MNKKIFFLLLTTCLVGCGPKVPTSSSSTSSSSTSSSSASSTSTSSSSSSSSSSSTLSSSSGGTYNPSDYYDGYYKDIVSWENSADLIIKLNKVIRTGFTPQKYENNWETNSYADHALEDYESVDVVYSGTNVLNSYTQSKWQREHAWPASLMTGSVTSDAIKQLGRATDFHNLFAAESAGNMSRGNKNYGIADKNNPNYTDRTINDGNDGYSYDPKTFEPGNMDKGRLSRALFYMATMYIEDEQDEKNGILMKGLTIQEEPVTYTSGSYDAFAIGGLSTLLSWANNTPVDRKEMFHNDTVYSYQNNRNPYVDYPELVDYAFGNKKDQPGKLEDLLPSEEYLHLNDKEFANYAIYQAPRTYYVGDRYSVNDITIYKINNDFSYAETSVLTSVNEGYTFTASDPEIFTITLNDGTEDVIKYNIEIKLNIKSCSYQTGTLSTSIFNINKTAGNSGVDKDIEINGKKWTVNYEVQNPSNALPFTNFDKGTSVKIGSGTNPLTKLTITSKDSVNINAAFVGAASGIANKTFNLSIAINGQEIFSTLIDDNAGTKSASKIYGNNFDTSHTGVITYTFTPSTSDAVSLILGEYALNEI
ncbi:MAG: endonuclease [Bacilli bacterium]|nr:endonuclease [Bacilli bacterium]